MYVRARAGVSLYTRVCCSPRRCQCQLDRRLPLTAAHSLMIMMVMIVFCAGGNAGCRRSHSLRLRLRKCGWLEKGNRARRCDRVPVHALRNDKVRLRLAVADNLNLPVPLFSTLATQHSATLPQSY